ncbi:hypothetical protein, partial [Plasmodium yoelii yoelii]
YPFFGCIFRFQLEIKHTKIVNIFDQHL